MTRLLRNPLAIINSILLIFLTLVVLQRTLDVSGAPPFVQNVFAAVAAITGEGQVNQVAAFSATNTIGNSIIYDSGSRIGIGNTSPTQQVDATGFVKGRQGLCIGNDCRTKWPFGEEYGICVQTSVVESGGTCIMTGAVEDNMTVPLELFNAADCKSNAQFNADTRSVTVHGFLVTFDPASPTGFSQEVFEAWTCYPGRGCVGGPGYICGT